MDQGQEILKSWFFVLFVVNLSLCFRSCWSKNHLGDLSKKMSSPDRSRSPCLHRLMSSELKQLPQPDRRGLQHLRNQIDLLAQWRNISILADSILQLCDRMTELQTDHPETITFMFDFDRATTELKSLLEFASAQCHKTTDGLNYLITSLGRHRDGCVFGSPRRLQGSILVSETHLCDLNRSHFRF